MERNNIFGITGLLVLVLVCSGNASSTNDTISTIQTTSSSKTVDTPTTPTESSDNTNSISSTPSIPPHATDSTTEHSTNVTTGTTIKPHATDSTTEHNTNVTTGTTIKPHVTDSTTEHSTNVTTGTTIKPHATDSTTEHNTNVTTGTTIKPHATDSTTEPITSISPGNHSTTPTGTETSTKVVAESSTSAGGTTVTVAPNTSFYISFKITNKIFNSSLTELNSDYYKALENQVLQVLDEIYGCKTCSTFKTYNGSTVLRFSQGSVVADTKSYFKTNDINAATVQKQFENSLKNNGDMINSLKLSADSIKVTSTDATPPSSQSGSDVPGWGIALLVLAALILLILLIILILMIIYCCMRRRRGQFNVFGIGGYYSMNDSAGYPMYSTHAHYEVPNGGSAPYNTVSNRTGSYTVQR